MFLTICLFNEGLFAITAAKTKMQKITQTIPAVEKDVRKQENPFSLPAKRSVGTAMLKNQLEGLKLNM